MKEKTKKKVGPVRIVLRVLAVILALLLCFAAVMLVIPLTETGDKTVVEGTADWMAGLDGSQTLNRYTIPGTHDSATQYVQLAFFSKCQSKNIGQQLEAGYRYLDIRLGADGDRLKLMHGFTNCKTSAFGGALYLDTVLDQCYDFLDQHPGETVIFAVKQEHGDESVAVFEKLLDSYVQNSPEHWLLTDTIPTLDEARGRLVLMRRYEDEAGLGAAAGIPLLWPNQNGYEDVSLNTAVTDNGSYRLYVQDRYEYNANDKWAAFLSGITEVAEQDVSLNFLSTKGTATYGHPYGFARDLNQRLMDTEIVPTGFYGWVVVDFASAPLAAHIISANQGA